MPVITRVVDKGSGGKYQIVTTKVPDGFGGWNITEKTITLREPNQPKEEGSVSSGNTTLVETLVLLLIIVNGFTSGQFKGLWGIITLQNTANPQQIRQGFLVLGGELVALVILSLVAKSSDAANKVVLMLVGTLWLGWFFHNQQVISNFTAKVQPGKPVKQGGRLTTV